MQLRVRQVSNSPAAPALPLLLVSVRFRLFAPPLVLVPNVYTRRLACSQSQVHLVWQANTMLHAQAQRQHMTMH